MCGNKTCGNTKHRFFLPGHYILETECENPENEEKVQLRMCGNVIYFKLPKLEAKPYYKM